ncbi:uncharacterized protein B0H18DRAFT_951805 [Fomitopsis serialis]|uniref:uncharacterized protein n=1 Tax=Fomitopsis serialis TaxID=139415 RepID=UPI002008A683|nr:uncharacterized protein B0H18DRAFT_951805 [Neoantrodia serialis]KAH9933837.1 hypothetical protein B0H18DRAFT_951805 [Neoantrodia serialis]
MPRKPPTFRVRFTTDANHDAHPNEAPSGSKSVSAKSSAASVPLEKLVLSSEQRTAVENLYNNPTDANHDVPALLDQFFTTDSGSQEQAQSLLLKWQLDIGALESIGTCWAQQWSRKTGKSRRVLLQCHTHAPQVHCPGMPQTCTLDRFSGFARLSPLGTVWSAVTQIDSRTLYDL